MIEFDLRFRKRFEGLSTTNVSDALDALGLRGATFGIRPIWEGAAKIVGPALTLKLTAAGLTRNPRHLGVQAIMDSEPGDVIVIDNGGRLDTSCWGGVLTAAAALKGISGVVIDGACRDVDEIRDENFPVFARGAVVQTARGRIMEESTNGLIQFGGVQVRPGDIILADRSGVVVIPREWLAEVVSKAEKLAKKEEAMIREIKAGKSILDVDLKYGYETMLKSD